MKKLKYLAFDIGCIECGEASNPLGIYNSEAEAEEVCKLAEKKQKENWVGEHEFEVFEVEI